MVDGTTQYDWLTIAARYEANGDLDTASRIRELIQTSQSHPSELVRDAVSRMLSSPRFLTDEEWQSYSEWEASQEGGFQQGAVRPKLGSC